MTDDLDVGGNVPPADDTPGARAAAREGAADLGLGTQQADTQPGPPPPKAGRFRHWRKSRPFWGGLLTMLAGLEIAVIPLMAYKIILVATSVTVATVIGVVIAVLGLVTWLTPSQSKLYGLLTIVFGVASFVASNVGGFLLGGLFAIVGGALTFAWETGSTASIVTTTPDTTDDVVDVRRGDTADDVVVRLDDLLVTDGSPREAGPGTTGATTG